MHGCDIYLNLKVLKQYFPAKVVGEIVAQVIEDKNMDYLEEMINKQKKDVLKMLNGMCLTEPGLDWITKNPGSQITGSFNPIVSDPKDWYGTYYKSKPSMAKVTSTEDACAKRRQGSRWYNYYIVIT